MVKKNLKLQFTKYRKNEEELLKSMKPEDRIKYWKDKRAMQNDLIKREEPILENMAEYDKVLGKKKHKVCGKCLINNKLGYTQCWACGADERQIKSLWIFFKKVSVQLSLSYAVKRDKGEYVVMVYSPEGKRLSHSGMISDELNFILHDSIVGRWVDFLGDNY